MVGGGGCEGGQGVGGHLHVSEIIFNLAKVAAAAAEKLLTSTPNTFDYLITESFFFHRAAINDTTTPSQLI